MLATRYKKTENIYMALFRLLEHYDESLLYFLTDEGYNLGSIYFMGVVINAQLGINRNTSVKFIL